MIMAQNNHQGFVCGGFDCNFTVSTSTPGAELDNFDQLLTLLLSVRGFVTVLIISWDISESI